MPSKLTGLFVLPGQQFRDMPGQEALDLFLVPPHS